MQKLLLTPYPAHVALTGEIARGALYCDKKFTDERLACAAEQFAATGDIPVRFTDTCTFDTHRGFFADPEGYILKISPSGADISASTPAGALYGAITLGHIARQHPGALPCGVIADKPAWRHRAVQVSYGQMNVDYNDNFLRHFIRSMADIKINTVYLYFEWRFQFPSIPETHMDAYMSPEQARAIQRYAARYNITVVPSLNVLGHTDNLVGAQAFQEISEYDSESQDVRTVASQAICTSNPRTRDLVARALNDIMDIFDSEIIHVGGDEVYALGVCERCRKRYAGMDKAEIYMDYYCWVRDMLRARGRRMGIWGDMLLGFLKEGTDKTMEQARRLMDGTVIFDWHYHEAHTREVELLAGAGADLILSTGTRAPQMPSPSPRQAMCERDYFADGFRFGVRGGLVTDWIYGYGYHGVQSGMLFAFGAALMWQGVAEDFARGSTADETLDAYVAQVFGAGVPLPEYWRLASAHDGELLCRFEGNLSGSYLRRSVYLDDSPLGTFVRYARSMRGESFDGFRAAVDKLGRIWDEVEAKSRPAYELKFIKGSLILYRFIAEKYGWGEELYSAYNRAALVQYTDPGEFRALLMNAAAKLRTHLPAFDEPIAFLTECRRELGLEAGSIIRLNNTRDNLLTLAAYIEHLAGGHRPLPSIVNMNAYLFARPLTEFWAPRSDEWYAEPAPFTRTDGDNGHEWGAAY